MGRSQQLYKKAKKIIPGGTQLLSKRPEMFLPDQWPAYYKKAKGVFIWDLDNKRYLDMSYMGIGANILGYADKDVDSAVKEVIKNGSMSTLNAPEEVELAELLFKLHPWAQMARYARTGGEIMAIAIRIARCYKKKSKVVFCGYHGWHDWYLSANLSQNSTLDGHLLPGLQPSGVPRELLNTSLTFNYNDIDSLKKVINKHKKDIAAIVMEPVRNIEPINDFLQQVRQIADDIGAVFIFDEISSGWRLAPGGAHLNYKVIPDLTVFAKGISNGYPMAALIGKADIMESAQDSFISSTYWTERIGPVAAIATIKKIIKNRVWIHLSDIGKKVQAIWKKASLKYNLKIDLSGIAPMSHFEFNYKNKDALKTFFIQLMLERGFLSALSVYSSFAHNQDHLNKYEKAVLEVFKIISDSIKDCTVEKQLKGPLAHTGFKRLN